MTQKCVDIHKYMLYNNNCKRDQRLLLRKGSVLSIMGKLTTTQKDLLTSMVKQLSKEFDWSKIRERNIEKLTAQQAYILIKLNKDLFYGILEDGRCFPSQYEKIEEITQKLKNRKPKKERWEIGRTEAIDFITKYRSII